MLHRLAARRADTMLVLELFETVILQGPFDVMQLRLTPTRSSVATEHNAMVFPRQGRRAMLGQRLLTHSVVTGNMSALLKPPVGIFPHNSS